MSLVTSCPRTAQSRVSHSVTQAKIKEQERRGVSACLCGVSACLCGVSVCLCGVSACLCGVSACLCGVSACLCGVSACLCGVSACLCGGLRTYCSRTKCGVTHSTSFCIATQPERCAPPIASGRCILMLRPLSTCGPIATACVGIWPF